MTTSAKVFILGWLLYVCPPWFSALGERWFGEINEEGARTLRKRFWRAFAMIGVVIGVILLAQWFRSRTLEMDAQDWMRVVAVMAALTAALGRGGWEIQTWKGVTIVERIDRGMYIIGQLGAAALLVFILTL